MPNDDLPRVVEYPGGRSIIYGAKHLYSPSGPVQRAHARARGTAFAESTLYILASPLLWHGVEDLLLSLPSSSHIAAVELDGNLQKIALEEIPRDIKSHPRLHFLKDCSAEEDIRTESISLLYDLGVENFRKAALISLNGGYRLNPRGYTRIQQFLQEEIRSFWKNKMTLIHMAPLWIKNIFLNTALYHRHIRSTAPSSDKPVLVVGAGPSAEKIVPLLRGEELRARVYIIAVDTALAPLTECGVNPDAVVIQEGQFYNVYDFIPLPAGGTGDVKGAGGAGGAGGARKAGGAGDAEISKKAKGAGGAGYAKGAEDPKGASAPFYWMDLTSADIIPRLRREPESLPEGSIRFFLTEFFPTRLFSRLGTHSLLPPAVPPLGSVGSTAVELALRNFSGPVYVCGVDFSFYYGKGHMRGATLNVRELIISGRFMPAGSSPILFPVKSVYSLEAADSPSAQPAGASHTPPRPETPKKITTATLRTYAETFKNRFSPSRRLYSVARSGADLGIPAVSLDDFQDVILAGDYSGTHSDNYPGVHSVTCKNETTRTSGGDSPISKREENTRERVRVFLKEEIELLRRLYAEGTKRLSGEATAEHPWVGDPSAGQTNAAPPPPEQSMAGLPSAGDSREEEAPGIKTLSLEDLVREADYLLHHFPDTGYSVPDPLSPGMIKRLLVSTGHYLAIVKRALTLLEN